MQYHPEASQGRGTPATCSASSRSPWASAPLVDIETVLVLGSGPIVISQAGEFDYSGTQACRALRAEGYRVVLVNSNPATIMTDPSVADRTYVEPLDLEAVEGVIGLERPDALLPTLGEQTALNLAMELSAEGCFSASGRADRRRRRGDPPGRGPRGLPRDDGRRGPAGARERVVGDVAAGRAAAAELGLPVILRPGFTLGEEEGRRTPAELEERLPLALDASPIGQALVEALGARVGRDRARGDARRRRQRGGRLLDRERGPDGGPHRRLGDRRPGDDPHRPGAPAARDAALAVIRAVGVSTGGANVQFALDRASGEMVVIEMNPRVSRSSALASKATGFPIAKIAARLAVGPTLDELPNEITGVTPAASSRRSTTSR